ncbi:hypothetical protein PAPYR_4799 [Paratrimastix pyriformis]|uniref:Uncharacterized protein n=1 Tax=Paratrimastix pyriformis TaxID=342808 RepID=A0ABQ8UKD0_9EUKA|nr:hypothetical protein PAPYR_4799 [Paratrimastix pyriformis]
MAATFPFSPKEVYYIGTWRRTPYRADADPLCLNGLQKAHLSTFDEDVGQLWKVQPHQYAPNAFIIECQEVGEARFLTGSLILSASQNDACVFLFDLVPSLRGRSCDVSVRIRPASKPELILCSTESTRTVQFMTQCDADQPDPQGSFVHNIAWEFSPDVDVPQGSSAIEATEALAVPDSMPCPEWPMSLVEPALPQVVEPALPQVVEPALPQVVDTALDSLTPHPHHVPHLRSPPHQNTPSTSPVPPLSPSGPIPSAYMGGLPSPRQITSAITAPPGRVFRAGSATQAASAQPAQPSRLSQAQNIQKLFA